MNKMHFLNFKITILFLAFALYSSAQDFNAITSSLKQGDVSSFAKHCDSNIELTILDNEAIYSKVQIQAILNNFFKQNPPTAYSTVHKGNSGNGAFFQIGELTTASSTYRTYIYAKNINGKFLIQQFRIEES